MCDCRADRLRSLAEFLDKAPVKVIPGHPVSRIGRDVLHAKLLLLAERMDAGRWDDDPGHLAQAVDAILDSAIEAFTNGETDQGVALVVGAEATVDELLKNMNLPDADEPADEPPSQGGVYSKEPSGTTVRRRNEPTRADHKFQMEDGSYPIDRCTGTNSVASAAKLAHNSKKYSFEQVKAHVLKAKKALGCPDSVLPATWTGGSNSAQKPGYERRNNLVVRAIQPGYELREAADGDGMPVLTGHFAVFGRWASIDSFWEGQFMESIAPGAFARTFKNDRAGMRVLFQHGRDPVAGNKPLGPIDVLEEDSTGARYEVPLLDASYVRDLLPGLRAGLYGASFRFRVMKEELTEKPERSEHNPDGVPERVVQEAQVMEFGPVTFPAYVDATAGIRSITDEYILQQFGMDPERLHELLHHFQPANATALPEGHENARSTKGTREDSPGRLAVIRNPNRRS